MQPLRIQKSKYEPEYNNSIYGNTNLGNTRNVWEVNVNKLVSNLTNQQKESLNYKPHNLSWANNPNSNSNNYIRTHRPTKRYKMNNRMNYTLTPAQIQAVRNGFTRVGKAPPAGYSPQQILLARQLGYPIPKDYRPGNGLNKVGGRRTRKQRNQRNATRKQRKQRGGSSSSFQVILNLTFNPAERTPENEQNIETTIDALEDTFTESDMPIVDYIKNRFTAQRLIEDNLMPLTAERATISNAQWLNGFGVSFTITLPQNGQPFTKQEIQQSLRTDSLEDGVYESVNTNGWTIKTMNENLEDDDTGYEFGTVDYRQNPITVN
jgi:hypothetical protein